MRPTTETDDPQGRPPRDRAGRRALVMVLPISRALDLPAHLHRAGRDWLADIGCADQRVSKDHVRFHTQGGTVSVEDLGSHNGTFVDGYRLEPGDVCSLRNRAMMRIGRSVFVFRDDFVGDSNPDEPLGELVGPFGLRAVADELGRVTPIIGARGERILIAGETGVGKELLAREVTRRLRPERRPEFVNVAAIPPHTFDSALFGHARGAFTDASADAPGLLKANAGGTVVLDEIGDLPAQVQPKLLRFLESGEIQALSKRPERIDVLLIGATNRVDLLAEPDRFRTDLLARFTWRFVLPPLRDRPEDVFAIAEAFATRDLGGGYERNAVDARAVEQLLLRPWDHGNAREVRRCVQLAATRAQPPALSESAVHYAITQLGAPREPRKATSLSRALALKAVENAKGDKSKAASLLGVSRGALLRKLES